MHTPEATLTLKGMRVRLEPLHHHHLDGLGRSCSEPALWEFLPTPAPRTREDWEAWLERALADRDRVESLPFAIIDCESESVAGSTRYLDISPQHGGIEIGWTFIAPEFQRTAVNTEAKLLLLTHAFETLRSERVCIKTDKRNIRAQRAIERLGAKYEGTLRRHRRLPNGYIRDSVYYSILPEEWVEIQLSLKEKLRSFNPTLTRHY